MSDQRYFSVVHVRPNLGKYLLDMSDQNTILPDILADETKIFILSADHYKHVNIIQSICSIHQIISVTYSEGFSFQYTGMGTLILVPKKWNISLFTLLFCIAGYFASQAMFLHFKAK